MKMDILKKSLSLVILFFAFVWSLILLNKVSVKPVFACSGTTSCQGCGRSYTINYSINCDCACQMPPNNTCVDPGCNATCDIDPVTQCPKGSVSAYCKPCAGGGTQPTPTPTPTPTSAPCFYCYFDNPPENTVLVAGNTYPLSGWAYFGSGSDSPGSMFRVDLHQCQPTGTTNNCRGIGNATYGLSRPDTIGHCGNSPANTGWSYNWTVPFSMLGQQTLWSIAINEPDMSPQCWKGKTVIVVTPTPTATPTGAPPSPTVPPPPTNTPTEVPPTPTEVPPTPTPTPIPSCSLTLSGPTAIDQGDIKDYVALVTIQDGGTSDVSGVNFFSSNSSIARVETGWVPYPPPYSTRVTGVFVGGPVTITGRANLSGGNTCSNNLDVTVGPPNAWLQTWGGDVHAQGPIFSGIPEAATRPYFNVDLDGYPGIISYINSLNVGAAERISSKKWNVDTSLIYPYDFAYFHKKLDPGTPANWDGTLPGAGELKIIYSENPTEVSGFTLDSGKKLIILVKNEVNIKGDIRVTKGTGSFLAIITSGNINLDSSVSHLEGVFISDGRFNVGSGNSQFKGEGIFYALGFNLPRDLVLGNSLNPAELFTFRPDLVVNTPVELRITAMSWQEVAP